MLDLYNLDLYNLGLYNLDLCTAQREPAFLSPALLDLGKRGFFSIYWGTALGRFRIEFPGGAAIWAGHRWDFGAAKVVFFVCFCKTRSQLCLTTVEHQCWVCGRDLDSISSHTPFGRQIEIEKIHLKILLRWANPAPDTTAHGFRRNGVKLQCHLEKHDAFIQQISCSRQGVWWMLLNPPADGVD